MITPKKYEYGKLLRNRYVPGIFMGLSLETRKTIEMLFRTIIESEIQAEKIKRKFTSLPNFSSYENFEFIKGKYKSNILKEDVIYVNLHSSFITILGLMDSF